MSFCAEQEPTSATTDTCPICQNLVRLTYWTSHVAACEAAQEITAAPQDSAAVREFTAVLHRVADRRQARRDGNGVRS